MELAYGQVPGYWEVRELLQDDSVLVAPVPGTADADVDMNPRRVPLRFVTRDVAPDEVSLRLGIVDGMRCRNSA